VGRGGDGGEGQKAQTFLSHRNWGKKKETETGKNRLDYQGVEGGGGGGCHEQHQVHERVHPPSSRRGRFR